MSQSTMTLLQAVNRVLEDIGERSVTTISNPASRKARNYLQDAVRFVVASHDWEWTYNRITATSWLGNSFTIPTARQVRSVTWLDYDGVLRELAYVETRQFDASVLTPFVLNNNRPLYYTIPSHQTISVNPYPTDELGQGRVIVYIIEDIQPPTNESGFFRIPDKYMQLVIKKADYYMAMHHLEDEKSAQFFDKDYNELMLRYRSDEVKTPTGGYNMYRTRTRRYLGGLNGI